MAGEERRSAWVEQVDACGDPVAKTDRLGHGFEETVLFRHVPDSHFTMEARRAFSSANCFVSASWPGRYRHGRIVLWLVWVTDQGTFES